MHNKYLDQATDLLKRKYNIDVVKDIILARQDRTILFGDTTDANNVILHVISGDLTDFGFEDNDSIKLKVFIEHFDHNNKYSEVAGQDEYFKGILTDILDFKTETNVTFPINVSEKRFWIRFNVVPIKNKEDLSVFFLTDVTKYLNEEEQLFEKTHKDSLTNLFNKYTLDYHYGLRHKFDNFHVLYLDLDDFKQINDTHGHAVGDKYLVKFANLLKSFEENYNRFYRIGGDEFVGFIFEPKNKVIEIAEQIVSLTSDVSAKECRERITVSIGIAGATTAEDLIRKADKVLYTVKGEGKNNFKYVTEDNID
jgi:diguanylate cyclase (GGDEF)-like protein